MTIAAGKANGVYFDPKIGARAVSVLPGRHEVTDEPDLAVTTLLGSCVSACIRNVRNGVGGLNHFLLPGEDRAESASRSTRYGVHAMEVLINDILRRGGRKSDLEAKIFGGANVIETATVDTVGARNAEFVMNYLQVEGIRVAARDTGGSRARRVFFFPGTGRASVLRIAAAESTAMRRSEARLSRVVQGAPSAGGVELF